ncbi:SPARC-like protein 1 [Corythoichthys intestinalis]|uniref:SPARC-like protein 1 n=1 Tax=Corythoichthys intestinalis TaxID=161448 RepID=UPI0025A64F18|nr:SPARC-like protein 1 [Corythoichthys intestinalis]XP_057699260.1 SPARC-like protein 1 [Corythoichthys intestinalis]XP_061791701.1 SPARC-like protein 1 [Nerophis lumbriciformis]
MRACIVFICLLAVASPFSVENNHHGKHRTPHKAKEKEMVNEEANKAPVLPTLVTAEASDQTQEEGEASAEDNINIEKKTVDGKSEAVLLSEKELEDLLKKEVAEEEESEKQKTNEEADDSVEEEEIKHTEKPEKLLMKQDERVKNESVDVGEMLLKETKDSEVEMKTKKNEDESVEEENIALSEESEGSTESKMLSKFDYASDSAIVPPLQIIPKSVSTLDIKDDKFDSLVIDGVGMQNSEGSEPQRASGQGQIQDSEAKDSEMQRVGKDENGDGKTRRPKKNQRTRKHSPQREEKHDEREESQEASPEMDGGHNNSTVQKAKRRRAGQWGPLVGVNPVQIRAKVDLYPIARPSPPQEAPPDPCDNFRCKRGKICKLDDGNKPNCVCQEPSECPPSLNEFDHVCGTDNKTYNTSCELFATKCKLEGTKWGHKLHLDYTGPCKLIPPCEDTELVQFPLRMRDWLKNVLLQLYEHDSLSPGYLTAKQRFRVKKIFESERRLHAGNHSAELLAQDFEKNYNMYIYPVHWQFAQLDQHPSDRILSHSELAPLRVPLVPMEHCTSRFFQECDADKDKQISVIEWTSCFGIKNNDIDVNLLF